MFLFCDTTLCNEFYDLICSSCVEKISRKENKKTFDNGGGGGGREEGGAGK